MCTSSRRPRIICPCLLSCTTRNHEYRKSGALGVKALYSAFVASAAWWRLVHSAHTHLGCFIIIFEQHYRLPFSFVLYILTTLFWRLSVSVVYRRAKKTPHVLCLVGANPGEDSVVCGSTNITNIQDNHVSIPITHVSIVEPLTLCEPLCFLWGNQLQHDSATLANTGNLYALPAAISQSLFLVTTAARKEDYFRWYVPSPELG
jgi:hypothetical protein